MKLLGSLLRLIACLCLAGSATSQAASVDEVVATEMREHHIVGLYPEMAAAGLWATPSDLARFAIGIQQSFAGKSNPVISQALTRQMLTNQKDMDGLGVFLQGEGKTLRFLHNGRDEGFDAVMVKDHDRFRASIAKLRRTRLRDGAFRWSLSHDLAEPAHFRESFLVGSWGEHLRQHERATVEDQRIEEAVIRNHRGTEPPRVSHFLMNEVCDTPTSSKELS